MLDSLSCEKIRGDGMSKILGESVSRIKCFTK